MENLYGDNFHWWVGVVEDRLDPQFLGRCKVRIVGYHTPNKSTLPTEDLPWAHPVQPITSAAMSGIGHTPLGPVEGTWVLGFFRDGEDCQEPVMLGTMGGIPGQTYYNKLRGNSNYGFQDPNKIYPLQDYIDQPDTNKLARNQEISSTIVKSKDDSREKRISTGLGDNWDQPLTSYNAAYPFNHVYQSESGHVIEIDDTPNNERITLYHKSGTFIDIDVNGTKIEKVVGDSYEISLRHNNVLIKGNANVTIEGDSNIYVKNDCNLEVDGDLTHHVHGDYEMKVAGKVSITSGDNMELHSKKEMEIFSSDDMKLFSRANQFLFGLKTDIKSLITKTVGLKYVVKSFAPSIPGAIFLMNDSVSSKSTQSPRFSKLIVPTREEQLTFKLDILGEDFEANAEIITRELNQAISDGIIDADELNATGTASETDATPAPELPLQIPGCGEINNLPEIPENYQISKYYKIEDLTYKAVCAEPGRRLKAQGNLSKREIACNLKALAEQVLDPIKEKYPNMIITSGFRTDVPEGGSLTSQHLRGQAADIQFPGVSNAEYFEIAKWVRANINYDQMLLEYKTTGSKLPWIHLSFNREGPRRSTVTFLNHKTAQNGSGVLLQLAGTHGIPV